MRNHQRNPSWPPESGDKSPIARNVETNRTTSETEDEFNISNLKTFLHKKIHSASSLILKPKTHTCKVRIVTEDDAIELAVADGTFMNEGLVFLKDELGTSKGSSTLFQKDSIIGIGFEFDLPYDINSTSILKEILGLKQLQSLTVKTNYIQTFPSEIVQIKHLQSLNLANNQIRNINIDLSIMRSLTSLNLANNQLTILPKELTQLPKLTHLFLNSNYIANLPSTFSKLISLKILNLDSNRISALPELHGMTNLEELDLTNNLLSFTDPLSETIIDRVKNIANLGNSNIKALTALVSLKTLSLRNNRLLSTPDAVFGLPHLQTLDLSSNSIQQIGDISSDSLTSLDLSRNLLLSIPAKIIGLRSILELKLADNNISSLPDLTPLTRLEILNLNSNQLAASLGNLTSLLTLKSLHLGNNNISNLPPSFGKLSELVYLNLCRNVLMTVPSPIFSQLGKLKKLDLSRNKLVALPYTISCLTNIVTLRLHGNHISVLPPGLVSLTSLTELSLQNLYVTDAGLSLINMDSDPERSQQLKMYDVVSLTRSAPHHLLVSALCQMSEETIFQEKIVAEGGVADVIHFIRNYSGRIQLEAVKILGNISNNNKFSTMLLDEGADTVLLDLLKADGELVSVDIKLQALITLSNLSVFDETRGNFGEISEVIAVLKTLAQDGSSDERIQRYSRKTLATLGALDNIPEERGIRILALDGGGSRGVTSSEILMEIEKVCGGKRIEDMFDLIGGTSAGGLIAVCIGMKKLPLDRVKVLQDKVCSEVFAHGLQTGTEVSLFANHWSKLQARFNHASQVLRTGSLYSSRLVEELYQGVVGDDLLIDSTMDTNNKVFLVSTLSNTFPPQIYLWRNYQYPLMSQEKSRYTGTMTQKIWEAMRASSSAPSYFDEFTCGTDKHQDGGCIANNPTAIAIHEAKKLWPNKKIDCIVSVGTGAVTVRENKGGFLERTVVEMIECATSVERVHDLLEDTWSPQVYFRFQPVDERYACDLDEGNVDKLEGMREAARQYAERESSRFKELAAILLSDRSTSA